MGPAMNKRAFNGFLASPDTLRVYRGATLLFASTSDRIAPLIEYNDTLASAGRGVTIFDRVMGNAAALLSIRAGCREVCSSLGSRIAIKTLDKYGIRYYLERTVSHIRRDDGEDMCPMEKLSLDKTPEEFYAVLKSAPFRNQE